MTLTERILALFGRGPTKGRAPLDIAKLEVSPLDPAVTPEDSEPLRQLLAEGQRSFTASDTLPTQMRSSDRQALKKAGVKFGKIVKSDPLFTYVTLPAGWTKIKTDHLMHSSLVDNKGRTRADIFYKAAFYDRRAELHTNRRFNVQQDYDYERAHGAVQFHVTDCDTPVFTTAAYGFGERLSDEYHAQRDRASDEAKAWLLEHYPNWESTAAYWD